MRDKKERCKIAKTTNNLSQAIGELIKASGVRQALVRQHKLMKPENTTTVLGIIDTTAGRRRGNPPRPVGDWLLRIDCPHPGADFNHININSKLTHIPDPHIPIHSSRFIGTDKTYFLYSFFSVLLRIQALFVVFP
ncbi:unnamed protein product, partial [Rotaria sp. Silwood2]